MTIEIAKEHEIRRLYDAEKWKRGTIASELGERGRVRRWSNEHES